MNFPESHYCMVLKDFCKYHGTEYCPRNMPTTHPPKPPQCQEVAYKALEESL